MIFFKITLSFTLFFFLPLWTQAQEGAPRIVATPEQMAALQKCAVPDRAEQNACIQKVFAKQIVKQQKDLGLTPQEIKIGESFKAGKDLLDAKKYEEALPHFNLIIKAIPRLKITRPQLYSPLLASYEYRGECLIYQKKPEPEKALLDFEQALKIGKNSRVYLGKGDAYRYQGKYDQALEVYQQATTAFGSSFKISMAIGNTYAIKNDSVHAIENYKKGVKLSAGALYPREQIGLLYFKDGNFDAAVSEFTEFIKYASYTDPVNSAPQMEPDYTNEDIGDVHFYRGLTWSKKVFQTTPDKYGDLMSKASNDFEFATNHPSHYAADAYFNLAAIDICYERFDRAIAASEAGIKIDPNNEGLKAKLAEAKKGKADDKSAKEVKKSADEWMAAHPPQPSFFASLGSGFADAAARMNAGISVGNNSGGFNQYIQQRNNDDYNYNKKVLQRQTMTHDNSLPSR